jgi:hypothetical protein
MAFRITDLISAKDGIGIIASHSQKYRLPTDSKEKSVGK